jgi:hypothetical protein
MSDQPIDEYHKLLNIIKGVDADDLSKFVVLTVDKDTRTLRINNWVWDEDLEPNPDWVRMTKPSIHIDDLHISTGDLEKGIIGIYWPNTKYFYDADDNCIYKCMNTNLTANNSDTDWFVIKYDYTDGICTQKRIRKTSVDDKAVGW